MQYSIVQSVLLLKAIFILARHQPYFESSILERARQAGRHLSDLTRDFCKILKKQLVNIDSTIGDTVAKLLTDNKCAINQSIVGMKEFDLADCSSCFDVSWFDHVDCSVL